MMYFIVACFIALDLVTGIIKALKDKKFTSTTMREGLLHKCALVLCVAFGIYEPMMELFAHPKQAFKNYYKMFIPFLMR